MSASDLVPRVVLLVTDLERENAELKLQLKEQEDKQLLIQITGPNRTPIHYEGSWKNGFSNGEEWSLFFRNNNPCRSSTVNLPHSSFYDLEIWFGGIFIKKFLDVKRLYGHQFVPDDNGSVTGMGDMILLLGRETDANRSRTGSGYISFLLEKETRRRRGPVFDMTAGIGSMSYADYNKLTNEQLDLEERIPLCSDPNFIIQRISFRKDHFPGVMSLLEKLGIPTTSRDGDVVTV